jgi:hypothetical protein
MVPSVACRFDHDNSALLCAADDQDPKGSLRKKKMICSLPESNERSSHDIIVQVRRLTTWPNELILFMTNLRNEYNISYRMCYLQRRSAAQRLEKASVPSTAGFWIEARHVRKRGWKIAKFSAPS